MTYWRPKSRVMFRPEIQLRAKSWSKAMKQPRGPKIISMAFATFEGYVESCIMGHHLWPCCLGGLLCTWAMVTSGPGLLPRTMAGSVFL